MVQSNGYRIQIFDISDTENVLCSPGLGELLERNGQKDENGRIHFARTFGGKMRSKPGTTYFNSRRIWGALRRFNPLIKLDPLAQEYPVFLIPEKKLTLRSLMDVLRDRFQGTDFDAFLSEGGIGKDRPICVPSCVHSDVIQLRGDMPSDVGSVIWGLLGIPHTSPYLPLYFGANKLPTPLLKGGPDFDSEAAFWIFRSLSEPIETAALKLHSKEPEKTRELLTLYSSALAQEALERAEELHAKLHLTIAKEMH